MRSDENIATVRCIVFTMPTKSIGKISVETGLKRSSVQVMLTLELKLNPYKM